MDSDAFSSDILKFSLGFIVLLNCQFYHIILLNLTNMIILSFKKSYSENQKLVELFSSDH